MKAKSCNSYQIGVADLMELLHYDPETGVLRWKVSRGKASRGKVAGTVLSDGYVAVRIYGVGYKAHRVSWALHYGEWPQMDIDHIDRDKKNNRITNLRLSTKTENNLNRPLPSSNRSGVIGVYRYHGKWRAVCQLHGKKNFLGDHSTKELAIAAYQSFLYSRGYHVSR